MGLVLMGWAMLSKSLIQLSFNGLACVPSLFDVRTNYDRGNEDNGDLFQKVHHSLASGQTTGREHNPAHQEKIGLKIY